MNTAQVHPLIPFHPATIGSELFGVAEDAHKPLYIVGARLTAAVRRDAGGFRFFPQVVDLLPIERRDEVLKKLESFRALDDDWNGMGGVPPSAESIASAITFVQQLPPGVATPDVMLSGDGSIGFFWSTDNAYADVAIEVGNRFSLFVRQRAKPGPDVKAERSIDDSLPGWLKERLSHI